MQLGSETFLKHVLSSTKLVIHADKGMNVRIHWKHSTILETSNKSVWSNGFWYVKVCIFFIHWDKTQILKKFPLDKINGSKNDLFFSFASSNSS